MKRRQWRVRSLLGCGASAIGRATRKSAARAQLCACRVHVPAYFHARALCVCFSRLVRSRAAQLVHTSSLTQQQRSASSCMHLTTLILQTATALTSASASSPTSSQPPWLLPACSRRAGGCCCAWCSLCCLLTSASPMSLPRSERLPARRPAASARDSLARRRSVARSVPALALSARRSRSASRSLSDPSKHDVREQASNAREHGGGKGRRRMQSVA